MESHSGHAARHGAGGLDHHPLVALQIEPGLDRLARQEVHLLHREGDGFWRRDLAQVRAGAYETIDPFRENDHIGVHLPAGPVGTHADHLAAGVLDELRHRRLADDDRTGLLDLAGEPFVELGADDGVAVRPFLVEIVGAVMQADMRPIVHHPEALLDDVALERGVLAEPRHQLFQHV